MASPTYQMPADIVQIEYEVKKSRFIARAGPASTRQQAMALLGDVRESFADARHHCWAYLLAAGSAAMSDDGEPSGTAGRPILNVLQHKNVSDVMVVVTRYFGGIKLGAGGLVRAYSAATQQAMDILPLQQHRAMIELVLHCDFAVEQAVRHWLGRHKGVVGEVSYADKVAMQLSLPEELGGEFGQFALANGCIIESN